MKHIEIMNLNLEDSGLDDCTLYPETCGCCVYCKPNRVGMVMP